jgi:N-acylneuraminate cytidylyltransferase
LERAFTLGIVLGRAGSKGLPGKNMLPVGGKPCAQWSVEHLQRSSRVDAIAVSSDAPEMLALARTMGVDAVDRPEQLASDHATVDDAARDALLRWEAQRAERADRIVILYANVPVRPTSLTDTALDLLGSSGCDSVQSYAPVGKYHPWWTAVVEESSGAVRPWEGELLNHGVYRRQDLPPAHIPDGGVIALTREALLLDIPGVPAGPHAFFGSDRRGIISAEGSVIDIDTAADRARAEAALREAR